MLRHALSGVDPVEPRRLLTQDGLQRVEEARRLMEHYDERETDRVLRSPRLGRNLDSESEDGSVGEAISIEQSDSPTEENSSNASSSSSDVQILPYWVPGQLQRTQNLRKTLAQDGLIGVVSEWWMDDRQNERKAIRSNFFQHSFRAVLPTLAAIPRDVLMAILDGQLSLLYLRHKRQDIVDYIRLASKLCNVKCPGIYLRCLVDSLGLSPTLSELWLMCEFLALYMAPEDYEDLDDDDPDAQYRGEPIWKLCMGVDNFIYEEMRKREAAREAGQAHGSEGSSETPPQSRAGDSRARLNRAAAQAKKTRAYVGEMTEQRARDGERRYTRTKIDGSYPRAGVREAANPSVREDILTFLTFWTNHLGHHDEQFRKQHRLIRPISYVGYSKSPKTRIKDHERHSGSSTLMCLVEAFFSFAYKKKWIKTLYQMRTFIVGVLPTPESAAPAEMILSFLTDAYTRPTGGLAVHNAGESTASRDFVSSTEWGFCAMILYHECNLQERYDAEAALWEERLLAFEKVKEQEEELEEKERELERQETAGPQEGLEGAGVSDEVAWSQWLLVAGNELIAMLEPVLNLFLTNPQEIPADDPNRIDPGSARAKRREHLVRMTQRYLISEAEEEREEGTGGPVQVVEGAVELVEEKQVREQPGKDDSMGRTEGMEVVEGEADDLPGDRMEIVEEETGEEMEGVENV